MSEGKLEKMRKGQQEALLVEQQLAAPQVKTEKKTLEVARKIVALENAEKVQSVVTRRTMEEVVLLDC